MEFISIDKNSITVNAYGSLHAKEIEEIEEIEEI